MIHICWKSNFTLQNWAHSKRSHKALLTNYNIIVARYLYDIHYLDAKLVALDEGLSFSLDHHQAGSVLSSILSNLETPMSIF